jgi:hypothetical protein
LVSKTFSTGNQDVQLRRQPAARVQVSHGKAERHDGAAAVWID